MRQSAVKCRQGTPKLHLVCGSGGSRAFLTNSGALLALRLAGMEPFHTIGGVSGGSLATLLAASGAPSEKLLEVALDTDFSRFVTKSDTIGGYLGGMLRRAPGRRARLKKGFMKTEALGEFAESLVKEWPANYWTMAIAGNSQIVFAADGVFEYVGGKRRQILSGPAPIGVAIRATCAIPGVLEAIDYLGLELYDGALGPFGKCPTGMARKHFKARSCDIVACELLHHATRRNRAVTRVGKRLAGSRHNGNREPGNVGLLIRPSVKNMHSLEFALSAEKKEQAVLAGFTSALRALALSGKIEYEPLLAGVNASVDLKSLRLLSRKL